ncbi:uncharacterized protein [Solanum tuberosum]|nr:PREDICTED: uncharacterized protein LOC102592215 [Solanum tuberosum]
MTAAGITKLSQRLQLIRPHKVHQIKRMMSRWTENIDERGETRRNSKEEWWVPHRRTGIYFPTGQERVMNDIPNGAASLPQNYWLRGEDGVEKPDPDSPIAYKHYY